jgi:hypothetical protein
MRGFAMRVLLFSILLTILPSVLLGQTEQPDIEGQVQNAWRHLSQEGLYTSSDAKCLGRLGDASAVALTKIIGGKALDERDIEAALEMIQLSYDGPRLASNDLDRQPRTTFFVLRYLHLATNNTK